MSEHTRATVFVVLLAAVSLALIGGAVVIADASTGDQETVTEYADSAKTLTFGAGWTAVGGLCSSRSSGLDAVALPAIVGTAVSGVGV